MTTPPVGRFRGPSGEPAHDRITPRAVSVKLAALLYAIVHPQNLTFGINVPMLRFFG